jgi:hypothetical protein
MALIDITGQRFGRLVVVARDGSCKHTGGATWRVQCDCGNKKSVVRSALILGRTQSCGCLASEVSARNIRNAHPKAVKHGRLRNGSDGGKLYNAWHQMIRRCEGKSNASYQRYGGRGICVCPTWRENFAEFAAHIGEPPSAMHSVDRINADGNYEPGNVRWATPKEQANNRRNNIARRV